MRSCSTSSVRWMPPDWRPTSRAAQPARRRSAGAPACSGCWVRCRFRARRSTSTSGSSWPRSTTGPAGRRADPGCPTFGARSSVERCAPPGPWSSPSCRSPCWAGHSCSPPRSSCSSSPRSRRLVLPYRRWRRRRSHWFRLPNRPNPRTSRHRDRARSVRRRPNLSQPRRPRRPRSPRFRPVRVRRPSRARRPSPPQHHLLRLSRRQLRPPSRHPHQRQTQAHPPRRNRGERRLRRADHRHRRSCGARSARLAVPDFR